MVKKCLQNDFFGLKMARNGAGNGENGMETTKYAKNAKFWGVGRRKREKTAKNEGRTTNLPNGTNGELKTGEKLRNGRKTRKMARKQPKTRGDCPRSDVGGPRSGKPKSVSIRPDLFESGSVVKTPGFWVWKAAKGSEMVPKSSF